MKFLTVGLAAALILACCAADATAREKKQAAPVPFRSFAGPAELPEDHPSYGEPQYLQSASSDTFCLVWFDFEPMDWQGWKAIDNGDEIDTFFHVDDFTGFGGGSFGRLVPIEGTKSAWCGVRGGADHYTCGWSAGPGYGNNWHQVLACGPFPFAGFVELSYHGVFDSEPDYDVTRVEYAEGDYWRKLMEYDGVVDTIASHTVILPSSSTKLRFHFESDGVWSDQDGLHDTDGACIIDSITVSDMNGTIHFEDFEAFPSGAKCSGFWNSGVGRTGFGTYTGLATNLEDKDPCNRNFSTQLIFFEGSPWMSDDYPGLPVTPFSANPCGVYVWPCQNVTVWSPPIDMSRYSAARDENQDTAIPPQDLAEAGGTVLRFSVYRDLPGHNGVFYDFKIRAFHDGCPQAMPGDGYIHYGSEREYIEDSFDISIDVAGADSIQVGIQVRDMIEFKWTYDCWYYHTPAPWIDNVRVYRYGTAGPQWSVRNIDLFQDTFPQEVASSPDPMEEFCRADMANDIAPGGEFTRIDPGDSVVVGVAAALAGGLDTLGTGEARVYFHCNVYFLGTDGKPDLFGPQLEGTYGSHVSDDGDWTVFLCEPARNSAGSIAPDRYCIDLNDSLFTRGYMVEYYFKAYALNGNATTYPHNAEDPEGDRYEFTCLPTLRVVPGVLYCDDYHNRGTFDGLVQVYMEPALNAAFPDDVPYDRYDTNGPTSGVSNGIGAYVSASSDTSVFCQSYLMVVHDSGDLNSVTITEGTENSDKSNDAQLLVDWMNNSDHMVGLLAMGDNVASDLSHSNAPVATELVSTICGVTVVNGGYYVYSSYYDLTGGWEAGGVVNPLITGVSGGPYDGLSYYADGGCPTINDFDVLETTGPGQYALAYPDYNSTAYYAGIFTDQLNASSQPLRTVWIGHSIMNMRDAENGVPARNEFIKRTLELFETGSSSDWTGAEIPAATSLSDNFPNPFNPSTRVRFGLKEKGHVSLRIYDVSGRLVRILIDDIRDAGSYEAVWDGANDEGRATASGIYFCRMEAVDYERTLKMVLLR